MKRKKPSKATGSPSFANPELEQIEQLLHFMTEHNLEEFEYSRGDLRIRLRKPAQGVLVPAQRHANDMLRNGVNGHIGSGQSKITLNADVGDIRIKKGSGFPPAPPSPPSAPASPNAPHLKAPKAPAAPVEQ